MPSCVVKWCRSHSTNKCQGISFHSFPSDEVRKSKWIDAVRLERQDHDWMPTSASKLCSIHFKDNDYNISPKGHHILKKTTVPVCTMIRIEKEATLIPLIKSNKKSEQKGTRSLEIAIENEQSILVTAEPQPGTSSDAVTSPSKPLEEQDVSDDGEEDKCFFETTKTSCILLQQDKTGQEDTIILEKETNKDCLQNPEKKPADDEFAAPEVKVEPPEVKVEPPDESASTIVIHDPLTDTTLEGSYRELFHTSKNPTQDPGVDPGEDSSNSKEDGNVLVIDEGEPPPKKKRQPKKPVLDISYYKKELARYKKEVIAQITEIQKQKEEIRSKDETIKRLNKNVKNLRDKNTAIRKENFDLKYELDTASRKITELKQHKEAAKATSLEVPNLTTKEHENFDAIVEKELSELAKQIDEQNLAIQIINSINDNLMKLTAQINKEITMASKECASQLLSSVNTELLKLKTQIRKQEMALATQKEKKDMTMTTQATIMDALNQLESFPESCDVDTAGLADSMD